MPTANGSTARAGHNGKAVVGGSLVYRLTEWTFNPTKGTEAWADSDSGGYMVRKMTNKDGTGTITGKYDTDRKPHTLFMDDDIGTLVLWEENTADYWYLPRVIFSNFRIGVSPNTANVIEWSVDFECDGLYYYPGQSGAAVATLPTS